MTLMDESDFNAVIKSLDDGILALKWRLARIAEAHHKNVDSHSGTFGECDECSWTWPCPTYIWATTDKKYMDSWED